MATSTRHRRKKTTRRDKIRAWFKDRKSPAGGDPAERKKYSMLIKRLEFFGIIITAFVLTMWTFSKLMDILNTSYWLTFSIAGFIAAALLLAAAIIRIKRWNGYEKGFLGLIVPIVYFVTIWWLLFHVSWPYLMAAKQFHMYG